jgi:hypothetical protein
MAWDVFLHFILQLMSVPLRPIPSCAVLCCAEIPHTVTENIPQLSIFHSHRCPTWVYRPLLLHAILSPCSAPPSPSPHPDLYPVLPLHPVLSGLRSLPRPVHRGEGSCPEEQSNVRIRARMVPGHDASDIRAVVLVRDSTACLMCLTLSLCGNLSVSTR